MGASQPMPNTLRERLQPLPLLLQLVLVLPLLPSLLCLRLLAHPQLFLLSLWPSSAANAMPRYDVYDHSLRCSEVRRVSFHTQNRNFTGISAFFCYFLPHPFARRPDLWPDLQRLPHLFLLRKLYATITIRSLQINLVRISSDRGAIMRALAFAFIPRGTGSGCCSRLSRHAYMRSCRSSCTFEPRSVRKELVNVKGYIYIYIYT